MSATLVLPPLVGRDQELKSLEGLMDAAFAGKGAVILVAGEAGVGKTRLCEEFGKLATTKGCEVIVGRSVPGPPTPYLPFQDAFSRIIHAPKTGLGLRQWISGTKSSTVSSEHPRIVRPRVKEIGLKQWISGSDLNPESESERTLHATLEFLRRTSAKRPIVMVLEDLHWADSPSIQLLHFIARNSGELRLLLVGTYRPEDVTVQESGRVHPFLDSLRIMRRERVCQEIRLDPLNLEELRLAIEGMLAGSIDPVLTKEIAFESGGNPLFAVETVRLLLQTGSIGLKQGVWQAKGRVAIDVPSTVKEIVLRRIDRLPADQRRLLECAAVIGESFDPTHLEGVLRLDRLNMLETLDLIDRTSQLVKPSDGLYRFSHEKIQRTIYDELSSPRRRELHRRTAELLESQPPDEALYGRLSLHFCASGQRGKCVRYSLLAGQSSLKGFGTAEAVGYFERVLEMVKEDPSLNIARSQALEGTGDAHKAMGLDPSAANYYGDFLKVSLVSRDKARVMRKCAECLLLANTHHALDLLELAERNEIERVERGRVLKLRGSHAVISGNLDQAQKFFSEAQEIFADTGSTEDLAKLSVSVSDLHLSRGATAEALRNAEEAVKLFSKLESPIGEATASFQLGSVCWNMGSYEQAMANYSKAITTLAKFGRYRALAEAYEYRAGVQYDIGDFESARTEALKAHEYGLTANSAYWQAHASFILSTAEFRLNRISEGEMWFRNGSELLKSLGNLAEMRSPLPILAAHSEAHLLNAKGDWAASKEKFLRSVELYRGTYWGVLHEALARTQFGEAALARGLTEEAAEQFGKAAEIYQRLGNRTQVEKLNRLLAQAS